MFCPNCGAQIKEGEKFCGNCGASLKASGGENRTKADSFTTAVGLAREGNNDGYTYLYEQTYKSKYYLALKYMDSKEAAEDVLQDAYVKAFSRLDTLSDPESFSSWFGTIVANTAKDALQKKNPVLFSDMSTGNEDFDEQELQIPDEDLSKQPEAAYTKKETSEMVQEMIGCLSEEQKMCILMYYIEGESIKDIASALGCSENTVKSRLNYGRKNLRAEAGKMEKKGYKLYGLAPIPLLLLLLNLETGFMESSGILGAGMAATEGAVLTATGAQAAASMAAGLGSAAAGSSVSAAEAVASGSAATAGSIGASAGNAASLESAVAGSSVSAVNAAAAGNAAASGGAAAAGSVGASAGAGGVAGAAAQTAAGAAGRGFIHTTAGHIAAGAAAVIVGSGAVFGGVTLYNNNNQEEAEAVVEEEAVDREGTVIVNEDAVLDPVTDAGDFEISSITFIEDYMTQEAIEEGLLDLPSTGTQPGYCASLTITNNRNEAYAATISFEYKISNEYEDGIHDSVYEDTHTYYLAPNETRKVSAYMAKSEDKGVDGYSYTGNWEGSYEPYRDGTVSASSVAEASLTSQDNGEVYVTFSVPNTTNDNWAGCLVNYDVLYQGMYAGSLNASYDAAVQPGENAAPTGDLNDLPLYGYVGANVNPDILGGKIELIVTNVTYDSSQTTEN